MLADRSGPTGGRDTRASARLILIALGSILLSSALAKLYFAGSYVTCRDELLSAIPASADQEGP